MRFLVLFMMSVLMTVGMFAIALGVVYVFFYNGNEKPAAKPQGTGVGNDDGKEDER